MKNEEEKAMAVREILLLGNGNLYEVCREISNDEIDKARQVVEDLHEDRKSVV